MIFECRANLWQVPRRTAPGIVNISNRISKCMYIIFKISPTLGYLFMDRTYRVITVFSRIDIFFPDSVYGLATNIKMHNDVFHCERWKSTMMEKLQKTNYDLFTLLVSQLLIRTTRRSLVSVLFLHEKRSKLMKMAIF